MLNWGGGGGGGGSEEVVYVYMRFVLHRGHEQRIEMEELQCYVEAL